MSWPNSWFKADYGDLTQRFIYADGAPFDGHPSAVRPVVRILTSPSFAIHAIATTLIGAALAVFLPAPVGVVALGLSSVSIPAYNVMTQRHITKEQLQEYPSLRKVLIDKSGRSESNPEAMAYVDNYFRNEIAENKSFTLGVTPIGAAVLTGIALVVGAPLWVGAATTAVAMTPYAMRLGWAVYARKQLHRAEKPWTVTTNLSPVSRKAPSPARRELAVAPAPVRLRA